MTITDTSKTVDVIAADDLNWLDKAPAPGRGFFTGKSNPRIDSFVDLLKQNPGVWAEFPDDVRTSSHSKQGAVAAVPGHPLGDPHRVRHTGGEGRGDDPPVRHVRAVVSHRRDLVAAQQRVLAAAAALVDTQGRLFLLHQHSVERAAGEADVKDAMRKLTWAVEALRPLQAVVDGEAPAAKRQTSIVTAKTRLPSVTTWRGKVARSVWRAGIVRQTANGLVGGRTCDEIERELHARHQSISSAVNYAEQHGWIRDSGHQRPTSSGSKAIVYEPQPLLIEWMKDEVAVT